MKTKNIVPVLPGFTIRLLQLFRHKHFKRIDNPDRKNWTIMSGKNVPKYAALIELPAQVSTEKTAQKYIDDLNNMIEEQL